MSILCAFPEQLRDLKHARYVNVADITAPRRLCYRSFVEPFPSQVTQSIYERFVIHSTSAPTKCRIHTNMVMAPTTYPKMMRTPAMACIFSPWSFMRYYA